MCGEEAREGAKQPVKRIFVSVLLLIDTMMRLTSFKYQRHACN